MSWFRGIHGHRSSGKARRQNRLTADEALDRLSPDLRELLARLEGQSRNDLQVTLQLLPLGSRLALDLVGAARMERDDPTGGRYRLKVLPFCSHVVDAAARRVNKAAAEGLQDSRTDDQLAAALHGRLAEVRISPIGDDSERALESLYGWLQKQPQLANCVQMVKRAEGETDSGSTLAVTVPSEGVLTSLALSLKAWASNRRRSSHQIRVEGEHGEVVLVDFDRTEQVEAMMRRTLDKPA